MPVETVIVVAAVVAAFSIFGGLMGWATSIAGPAFPGYSRASASRAQLSGVGHSVAVAH